MKDKSPGKTVVVDKGGKASRNQARTPGKDTTKSRQSPVKGQRRRLRP